MIILNMSPYGCCWLAACGLIWGTPSGATVASWLGRQADVRPDTRPLGRPAVKMVTLTGFALLVVALANPDGHQDRERQRAGATWPSRVEQHDGRGHTAQPPSAANHKNTRATASAWWSLPAQMPLTNDYGAAKLDQVSCMIVRKAPSATEKE